MLCDARETPGIFAFCSITLRLKDRTRNWRTEVEFRLALRWREAHPRGTRGREQQPRRRCPRAPLSAARVCSRARPLPAAGAERGGARWGEGKGPGWLFPVPGAPPALRSSAKERSQPRRRPRSMHSAARRDALPGAAQRGRAPRKRRRVAAMAAEQRYPRSSIEDDFNYGSNVASASVHIRMGKDRGAVGEPHGLASALQALAERPPLPPLARRWGDGALRCRQVPLWHPGHLRPWLQPGSAQCFSLAEGWERGARALFSPG